MPKPTVKAWTEADRHWRALGNALNTGNYDAAEVACVAVIRCAAKLHNVIRQDHLVIDVKTEAEA